jgi:tetratricopeptide (TPR) repeat protein
VGSEFVRAPALLACFLLFLFGAGRPAVSGAVLQEDDVVQRYEAADTHFFKAEEFFLKLDFDDARSELSLCLALMPEHSEAHYLAAQVNFRQRFLNRALDHIVKAEAYYDFASKVRSEQQKKLLIELGRMRDEQDAILTELRRDMALHTDVSSRQALEARILQAQKIKTNIEDRLLSPLSLPVGGEVEYHFLHAEILVALKRLPEAEARYRTAIDLAPTLPDAYDRLARLMLDEGQAFRALEVIKSAEEKGITLDEKLRLDVQKALGKKS